MEGMSVELLIGLVGYIVLGVWGAATIKAELAKETALRATEVSHIHNQRIQDMKEIYSRFDRIDVSVKDINDKLSSISERLK